MEEGMRLDTSERTESFVLRGRNATPLDEDKH